MDQTTLLFAAARFASAVGRLCLGPFLPLLTKTFEFPDSAKPTLLSSYSSGYILTQILGGYLADQYGFAIVTCGSVGLSAIILGYIAQSATTVQQWTVSFFVLGILAGPLFPAGSTAISTCVPAPNRAAAAAIIDASASAGTTVASLAPLLAVAFGSWRGVYQATALCLSLVALAAWNLHIQQAPPPGKPPVVLTQQQTTTTTNTSNSSTTTEPRRKTRSLAALFLPASLCTYLCHFVDNFTKYSINSWAATMFFSKHGASQQVIGSILGGQEAVGVLSKALVGVFLSSKKILPSSFVTRGWASTVAFVVQAAALAGCFLAADATTAALCMIVSSTAVGIHAIGFRPMYFEASPVHAGSISGVGNTIASFASVLGPVLIGSSMMDNTENEHHGDNTNPHPDDKNDNNNNSQWWNVAVWMFLVNLVGALAAFTITLIPPNHQPCLITTSKKEKAASQ